MALVFGILGFIAIEFVVFFVAVLTASAENCSPGDGRWDCSEFLKEASGIAFYVLLGVISILIGVAIGRARAARR